MTVANKVRTEWRARTRTAERGAAAVEFVMMSVLLLFLLLGVLQVAVYFYARNVVASSAADAARYAASVGVPGDAGAARARELIGDGLDAADARDITCTSLIGRDARSGLPTVRVTCRGRVRLLFSPLRLPLTVDVSSTVLKEQTP
jgi:Flp pilus assembly protein TadG